MNRRDFLRRSAILAAGVVAADQIELLERLTHQRRLFPGADLRSEYNEWPVGLGELLSYSSLHSISTTTYPLVGVAMDSRAWGRRG